MKVSKSGYYDWRKRPKRIKVDELGMKVLEIFHKSRGVYGVRRVKKVLESQGIKSSLFGIRKKFHKYSLVAKAPKRYKAFKDSISKLCSSPNLLNQKFYTNKPNEFRVSDFTYIKTSQGFKYLTIVMDLFSRRIVGWELSNNMDSKMILSAVNKAVSQRNPRQNLIIHSDRGSQYSSHIYQEFLAKHKFKCSMSSPGNPYDNSPAESFFHSLKVEWLSGERFINLDDLYFSVLEYIEVFYNRQRLHSYLDYLSPVSFERKTA